MVAVLSGIVIFILAIWEILSPQQVVTRFVQNEVYTLFKTLYASDVFITLLSSAFFIIIFFKHILQEHYQIVMTIGVINFCYNHNFKVRTRSYLIQVRNIAICSHQLLSFVLGLKQGIIYQCYVFTFYITCIWL